MGLEQRSRWAVFVDRRHVAFNNQRRPYPYKLLDKAEVMATDVCSALRKLSQKGDKFYIIFLDPPYGKGLVEETLKCIVGVDIMKPDTLIVAEHDVSDTVPQSIGNLTNFRQQKYGDTIISFYRQEDK